ncbi:MAG: ABC transporter ATP-binding protein/permease [Candidatus Cloacimonetes bacterium]|nr:ABC transporter ATP-binding protein/permease [Candidatus Cloacimonadota bacterium]
MNTFKKITPYIKQNLHKISFGILLLIIIDIVSLIIPKIMQYAIDGLETEGFTKLNLFYAGGAIFLIAALMAIMRYFWRFFILGTAWFVDRSVRQEYFEHLMSLSANFYNKIKTGDLMAYAINDLNAVRMLVGFGFVIGVDIFVLTAASLFFMVSIDLKLTLMAIIPLPLLSIMIVVLGKKIHHRFGKVQETFAVMSGKVQESISGIRVVKAFVQEESELEKISDSAYDYVKQNLSLVRIQGMFHPSFMLIIGLSMMIVMVFGGIATMTGEITIGQFIAFFQYLGMFVWPMIAIGWVVNLYQRGTASLKRLNKIFDEQPEIIDEESVEHSILKLKGKINFKQLTFRYNEETQLIFDNVSFSIDAGKTLAIVGRTGCGKSTIIDLITRIYNPPKESIFIDNKEIYKISLQTLRENIIMIPQDIFLFSDTIKENIILGKQDSSFEEIVQATKNAQVYNDIIDFPKGFETIVGERGVTLSGGQKQRIAIARALLTDPNVLILDDALSAVDTKTEQRILEQLIRLRAQKTTIIIAHRISSLQHADKIIVIDAAKIVEEGTHKELLEYNGIYKDLFEKQQLEEKISSTEHSDKRK